MYTLNPTYFDRYKMTESCCTQGGILSDQYLGSPICWAFIEVQLQVAHDVLMSIACTCMIHAYMHYMTVYMYV